ncbi:MAG: zinc-ribbon domain-containing protein [Clostridiales bacterium]|nr:zinc-ribbon domain-containing protein [Clostridiales bacterium]
MFCKNCGTQLTDDSRFCYKCGTPTHIAEQKDKIELNDYDPFEPFAQPAIDNPAPQTQTPQQAPTQNTTSTAADEGIFGIVGFVLAFFCPIVGLVLSIIGMTKKKYNNLATAGFVLSIIFTILYIIIIVIAVENSTPSYPYYYYRY